MTIKKASLFIAALALGIAAGSMNVASAQTPEPPPPPLKDADVKGFAAAIVDLTVWARENADRWDKASEKLSDKKPTSENMDEYFAAFNAAWGESGEIAREAERIVKRHGFSSMENWSEMSSRIMLVYTAIEIEKAQASTDEGMESMLKGLAASGLSAEQQAEMKKALSQAKEEMDAFQSDISPIDRKVVQRNMELIEQTMQELREM
jgi:hypothetical protein